MSSSKHPLDFYIQSTSEKMSCYYHHVTQPGSKLSFEKYAYGKFRTSFSTNYKIRLDISSPSLITTKLQTTKRGCNLMSEFILPNFNKTKNS